MLFDISSMLAGAVLLKLPLSSWPLINGTLAVFAACWAVALVICHLSGLRGGPLVRRSVVYALVITPLALYVALRLGNRAV